MSRPRRPPRAWIGAPKPVDPLELLGPRGLTQELLDEPEPPEGEASGSLGPGGEMVAKDNHSPRPPGAASGFPTELDRFHRSLLTDARLARIESVIQARLGSVAVVLDRLLDPHNTAAILRSAEGLGIGAAWIVPHDDGDAGAHRRVTRDADKWLSLRVVKTGALAARELRAQGFAVYAGHLDERARLVHELPIEKPLALLFGNEHEGPSPETLAACEGSFRIPMAGFTQSFNVSVAAGIAMHAAAQGRRAFLGAAGDLSEPGKDALRARFWKLAAKLARRIQRPPGSGDPEQNE